MYAIVNLNGKQYKVEEGRYIDVDRLSLNEEESFDIDQVQFIMNENGAQIGAPYLSGAKVQAKVLKHDKAKKIIVYKMRCKKGYRRKQGHRQGFTRIQIESIKSA